MTATYTFDVFSSLDGYGSNRGAYGGYGVSRARSCWPVALTSTTPTNGWCSGPTPTGCSYSFLDRASRIRSSATRGSPG